MDFLKTVNICEFIYFLIAPKSSIKLSVFPDLNKTTSLYFINYLLPGKKIFEKIKTIPLCPDSVLV